MWVRLTALTVVVTVTLIPATGLAQATKPLSPGVYFLWNPPTQQTTTVESPIGPNFDWVAEQTGRATSWGLPAPGRTDAQAELLRTRIGARPPQRPEAPYLLTRMWYRLADTRPGDRAPDLWAAGTDRADAGVPLTLWVSNEGVLAGDQVFVSVRVDPAVGTGAGVTPTLTTVTGALPPGSYDSKFGIALGTLATGTYRVAVEAWDPSSGLRQASARTLIVH
jgi:hypothetical protein